VNVFWHEMRSYRRSTILWTVSLSLMVILFLNMFTLFTQDIDTAKKLLDSFPPAVKAALGITLGNFFTIFGFFGYLLTYVLLAGAIQGMNFGVGALSKEDSGKTADFLLTKPISRANIVTSKLLAAVTSITITSAVFAISALLTALAVSRDEFNIGTFLLLTAILFLVQLFFVFFGALLSVVIPKIKSVIAVSLPAVFLFFIISTLGAILGEDKVRYVTPFKFYDVPYIIAHGSYELKFVLIEAVCIVTMLLLTYILYIKKDIRAAS
jgi:beta-exotoxin I transport system permease protein